MDTSKQAVTGTVDERSRREGERILCLYRRQMTKYTLLALLFGAAVVALLTLQFLGQPIIGSKLFVALLSLVGGLGCVLSLFVRRQYKQWHDSLVGFMAEHEKEVTGA